MLGPTGVVTRAPEDPEVTRIRSALLADVSATSARPDARPAHPIRPERPERPAAGPVPDVIDAAP